MVTDLRNHVSMLRERLRNVAKLVEATLASTGALGGALRAYAHVGVEEARRAAISLDEEISRGQVRGPLPGIPDTVKNAIAAAEQPTAPGSAVAAGHQPTRDATIVARLRQAEIVINGRTMTQGSPTDKTRSLRAMPTIRLVNRAARQQVQR